MKRPVISSLWIKGALSYIELLSMKSYLDCGHPVKLYHYGQVENAPSWLPLYDAKEIMPISEERMNEYKNNQTIIANFFRYYLQAKTDEVWSDCDVYCIRPVPDNEYIYALESHRPIKMVSNSLIRIPSDSPAIHDLIDFLSTDYPNFPDSPHFFDPKKGNRAEFDAMGGSGKVHLRDMIWGTSGPRAFTHFLDKYDLVKRAWPITKHTPFMERMNSQLARPRPSRNLMIPLNTQSIHFFGSSLRRKLIENQNFINNEPLPGSFLFDRLKEHGIDPKDAPLVSAIDKLTHEENRKVIEE